MATPESGLPLPLPIENKSGSPDKKVINKGLAHKIAGLLHGKGHDVTPAGVQTGPQRSEADKQMVRERLLQLIGEIAEGRASIDEVPESVRPEMMRLVEERRARGIPSGAPPVEAVPAPVAPASEPAPELVVSPAEPAVPAVEAPPEAAPVAAEATVADASAELERSKEGILRAIADEQAAEPLVKVTSVEEKKPAWVEVVQEAKKGLQELRDSIASGEMQREIDSSTKTSAALDLEEEINPGINLDSKPMIQQELTGSEQGLATLTKWEYLLTNPQDVQGIRDIKTRIKEVEADLEGKRYNTLTFDSSDTTQTEKFTLQERIKAIKAQGKRKAGRNGIEKFTPDKNQAVLIQEAYDEFDKATSPVRFKELQALRKGLKKFQGNIPAEILSGEKEQFDVITQSGKITADAVEKLRAIKEGKIIQEISGDNKVVGIGVQNPQEAASPEQSPVIPVTPEVTPELSLAEKIRRIRELGLTREGLAEVLRDQGISEADYNGQTGVIPEQSPVIPVTPEVTPELSLAEKIRRIRELGLTREGLAEVLRDQGISEADYNGQTGVIPEQSPVIPVTPEVTPELSLAEKIRRIRELGLTREGLAEVLRDQGISEADYNGQTGVIPEQSPVIPVTPEVTPELSLAEKIRRIRELGLTREGLAEVLRDQGISEADYNGQTGVIPEQSPAGRGAENQTGERSEKEAAPVENPPSQAPTAEAVDSVINKLLEKYTAEPAKEGHGKIRGGIWPIVAGIVGSSTTQFALRAAGIAKNLASPAIAAITAFAGSVAGSAIRWCQGENSLRLFARYSHTERTKSGKRQLIRLWTRGAERGALRRALKISGPPKDFATRFNEASGNFDLNNLTPEQKIGMIESGAWYLLATKGVDQLGAYLSDDDRGVITEWTPRVQKAVVEIYNGLTPEQKQTIDTELEARLGRQQGSSHRIGVAEVAGIGAAKAFALAEVFTLIFQGAHQLTDLIRGKPEPVEASGTSTGPEVNPDSPLRTHGPTTNTPGSTPTGASGTPPAGTVVPEVPKVPETPSTGLLEIHKNVGNTLAENGKAVDWTNTDQWHRLLDVNNSAEAIKQTDLWSTGSQIAKAIAGDPDKYLTGLSVEDKALAFRMAKEAVAAFNKAGFDASTGLLTRPEALDRNEIIAAFWWVIQNKKLAA